MAQASVAHKDQKKFVAALTERKWTEGRAKGVIMADNQPSDARVRGWWAPAFFEDEDEDEDEVEVIETEQGQMFDDADIENLPF